MSTLEMQSNLLLSQEPKIGPSPWFNELQADAWKTFQSLPMPQRTDEPWRFANLKALDLSQVAAPVKLSEAQEAELVERSIGLSQNAGRMVFANDQLLERSINSSSLKQQGVIWTTLEQAVAEHADLFRKHFMTQQVQLGSRKFAELHKALVKSGTFLYVPRNVQIELPIEVFHWLHGVNGSTFPHTLLIAGENSKVTLVDYFQSSDAEAPGFACGVNDLFLEAGAQLTYVCVQNWSRRVRAVQINSTVVSRDANATSLNLNAGAAYARAESVSRLVGSGARSDMLAVSVASEDQEYDQRTLQDHQHPHTTSDLLYKNALDGKARTIFAGLIKVQPDAHFTDAYQKVRNLLLSDDAEANSMPGLEILADEVRCTHGATTGQVSPEELYYLLARGISKKTAHRLIVTGFLNEVVERLPDKALAANLEQIVAGKLEA